MAATNGVPRSQVEHVIDQVGLREVARKRAGGFSLGMGQRLGIASALLADPRGLILDEPVNGLDPEGIVWIRNLMHELADEGRTILVSSHLMNEMAVTAEHLIVIGRGRLIADLPMREFIVQASHGTVRVRTPHAAALRDVLVGPDITVTSVDSGLFEVTGLTAEQIGDRAAGAGLTLHELTTLQPSLEAAFMELTSDSVEYHAHTLKEPSDVAGRDLEETSR
jgi:ABC-2 type transport system ATP-binding protein